MAVEVINSREHRFRAVDDTGERAPHGWPSLGSRRTMALRSDSYHSDLRVVRREAPLSAPSQRLVGIGEVVDILFANALARVVRDDSDEAAERCKHRRLARHNTGLEEASW